MAHDVFISYSSEDKPIADAVCATLERNQIRCWIAPRDILPSQSYGEAIVDAISRAKLMVLVFSPTSNSSPQVLREVERAVSKEVPIVPFRIAEVSPTKSMEYFLSAPHWLDAITPPMERHLEKLATVSRSIVDLPHDLGDSESPQPEFLQSSTTRPSKSRRMAIALSAIAVLIPLIVFGVKLFIANPPPESPAVPNSDLAVANEESMEKAIGQLNVVGVFAKGDMGKSEIVASCPFYLITESGYAIAQGGPLLAITNPVKYLESFFKRELVSDVKLGLEFELKASLNEQQFDAKLVYSSELGDFVIVRLIDCGLRPFFRINFEPPVSGQIVNGYGVPNYEVGDVYGRVQDSFYFAELPPGMAAMVAEGAITEPVRREKKSENGSKHLARREFRVGRILSLVPERKETVEVLVERLDDLSRLRKLGSNEEGAPVVEKTFPSGFLTNAVDVKYTTNWAFLTENFELVGFYRRAADVPGSYQDVCESSLLSNWREELQRIIQDGTPR